MSMRELLKKYTALINKTQKLNDLKHDKFKNIYNKNDSKYILSASEIMKYKKYKNKYGAYIARKLL